MVVRAGVRKPDGITRSGLELELELARDGREVTRLQYRKPELEITDEDNGRERGEDEQETVKPEPKRSRRSPPQENTLAGYGNSQSRPLALVIFSLARRPPRPCLPIDRFIL